MKISDDTMNFMEKQWAEVCAFFSTLSYTNTKLKQDENLGCLQFPDLRKVL